jgi:hypothetical protein
MSLGRANMGSRMVTVQVEEERTCAVLVMVAAVAHAAVQATSAGR